MSHGALDKGAHRDAVPVLMYHSISAGAGTSFRRFAVPAHELRWQLEYLTAHGYSAVTAAQLAGSDPLSRPSKPVVLTFDDAYEDFLDAALPLLVEFRFTSSLYVPTSYVGGQAGWLQSCGEGARTIASWSGLADAASAGVEIASHTVTHPQLDRLRAVEVRRELQVSRQMLEDKLGRRVDGFAYPFGYWTSTLRQEVMTAGYRYACAVDDLISTGQGDVFNIPRRTVPPGLDESAFATLLAREEGRVEHLATTAKRTAWRWIRKASPRLGGDPREGSGLEPSL